MPPRSTRAKPQPIPPTPSEPEDEDMEMSEDDKSLSAPSEGGEEDEDEDEDDKDVEDGQDEYVDEDMDEDAPGEEDDEEPEPPQSSFVSPSPSPRKAKTSPKKQTGLKIKLRLPQIASTPASTAAQTPSDVGEKRPRRGATRNVDIESEDSDEEDGSTRSASIAGPSRMTHRQAALAGVVERSEHVSLEEPSSKRKKQLNEAELAVKREETARKRKNLSEKKLEDEKTETINRLLRKQSRSRNKKNALATVEQDEEGDEEDADSPPAPPPPPTLFRWVSTSQGISFSVPTKLGPYVGEEGDAVLARSADPVALKGGGPSAKIAPICNVEGCTSPRKYKLVKDPNRGGCGLEHLKALQNAMVI